MRSDASTSYLRKTVASILFFCSEDEGNMYVRSFSTCVPGYTVSHLSRPQS
jgi:hypothetical protein